jgi:hypothetical protein
MRGAAGGGEGVVSEHQEFKAHLLGVLGRGGDGRRWGSHGGRGGDGGGARWRGASRRGGWPSSSLIATAGGGEGVGVVGLRGEGAEVGVRQRQELTGEKGNDGEVVPVEVRPRGVAWERQ